LANYTQLQTDIVSMMARSDIDTDLVIRLAEEELNRRFRLRAMLSTDTLTPALTGDRYIAALPSDFLELEHAEQDDFRLTYRTPFSYDADDEQIYTIIGTNIHVTDSADIAIWYYAKETALSDTNQTNAFTTTSYDGLLYLCLAHCFIYFNELDKARGFQEIAATIISNVQNADDMASWSGSPLMQRGG